MAFAFYTLLKHDSFSNILTHSLFKILTFALIPFFSNLAITLSIASTAD